MIFFAGLDGHTPRHGARAQHGYVRTVLDPLFGRLLEAMREYDAHRSDLLEHYTFILTSDHGNAQARADKHHTVPDSEIAAMLREQGRLPYYFQSGDRLRAVDTILLNHGGSLHMAVKNGETRNWYDPPRLHDDLFAIGMAMVDASKTARGFLHPGWLDIVLVKDIDNKRYLVLKEHKVYEAEKFFDPASNRDYYPDGAARVLGHYSQRSADLILLPSIDEGFHFAHAKPRPGVHGGLTLHDSLTACAFSGKRVDIKSLLTRSLTDIAPTIASLFDANIPSAQGTAMPVITKSQSFQLFSTYGLNNGSEQ